MPRRSTSRISNNSLKRKPGRKPIEIRDCDLRGFILRIEPSGTKTYYCEWARGKRTRVGDANVMLLDRARKLAKKYISDAGDGKPPTPQIRSGIPTLKKFVENHYEDWAKQNQKSGEANANRILTAFADFANTRLDKLTAWQIEKWKSARLKSGTAPATVNRDLLMLKAALSKAVAWNLVNDNPARPVKPLKGADNPRVRYLNKGEENRLQNALEARESRMRTERETANAWRAERGYDLFPAIPGDGYAHHLFPMILLAMNTGLRFGELTSLTWDNVRLEENPSIRVRAAYSKSGKERYVPLNSQAGKVLEAWSRQQAERSGLVFTARSGSEIGSVKTAWKNIKKEAKLHDFRWHDFRHHFASRLVMAGVDLNTVRELLGHGSLQMTLRYAHLAPEHKAAAVELLSVARTA